ncbi:MAG TPA: glycosyltransferase [Planctomycetota bacterium]|nr:glycosyltransferase [Planctomycetota bacterium]
MHDGLLIFSQALRGDGGVSLRETREGEDACATWSVASKTIIWHILTGEFPPQKGGVADYTALIARKLADAGDEVHVWAPGADATRAVSSERLSVHDLPGKFGFRALRRLGCALRREKRAHRLLVQYVPQMYGMRGMNVVFALWIKWCCPVAPWVMFHEVAFPPVKRPLRHRFFAWVQRRMARWIAKSMSRGFVSVPLWEQWLDAIAPGHRACEWLPVPSNVATCADPARVAALRTRIFNPAVRHIAGHFGTFGNLITDELAPNVILLLKSYPEWGVLLVGRGSQAFAEKFLHENREFKERVYAAGELDAERVAEHLACADVLYQPYPDGVSSRRSSAMAGLALGIPIVTNSGPSTEPIWREKQIVRLVDFGNAAAACAALAGCSADMEKCKALSQRARDAYEAHFSVAVAVERLREAT